MTQAHLLHDAPHALMPATAAADAGAALRGKWAVAPSFDVRAMTRLLDHDNHDMRQRFRSSFSKQPLFLIQNNVPLEKERELALQSWKPSHPSIRWRSRVGWVWAGLQLVCDNDFISVTDFRSNPKRVFAAHELVGQVDGSTATKMTVQAHSHPHPPHPSPQARGCSLPHPPPPPPPLSSTCSGAPSSSWARPDTTICSSRASTPSMTSAASPSPSSV